MKGGKLIILLLVVAALLFVATLFVGSSGEDEEDAEPPGWLEGLGALAGPLTPSVELPRKRFVVNGPIEVPIAPSEDRFRKAKFRVTAGAGARLSYEAPSAEIDDLKRQEWPRGGDDPRKGSFIILESGGVLRLAPLAPGSSATVEFE